MKRKNFIMLCIYIDEKLDKDLFFTIIFVLGSICGIKGCMHIPSVRVSQSGGVIWIGVWAVAWNTMWNAVVCGLWHGMWNVV